MVQREKSALRRGSLLGKYRLESRIGSGSFADVWKATDLVERRPVALKVAHAGVVAEWGRAEVEHEARIAARLQHPNIVGARNADWIDGRFVMATDLATTPACATFKATGRRSTMSAAFQTSAKLPRPMRDSSRYLPSNEPRRRALFSR